MKNRIAYLCFALLAALSTLCSCEKENEVSADKITVSEGSDLMFGPKGGNLSVSFNASAQWTAKLTDKNVSWVTLDSRSGGAGDNTITLTADENTAGVERKARLMISCGEASATVTVTQSQNDAIGLSQKEFAVPFEGGQISVTVNHNVELTCVMPQGVDWITQAQTRAMSSSSYTFNVAASQATEERSAVILFENKEKGLSEKLTVIQEAFHTMPDDEAWYTTSNGRPLPLVEGAQFFDTEIVSNTYEYGRGILKLKGAPTKVIKDAVYNGIEDVHWPLLTSFQIPSSVRTIEMNAFAQAQGLKEIVVPEGVEVIGESAFASCRSLERVTLPSTITEIGYVPFNYSPVKEFLGPCKFIICDGQVLTRKEEGIDPNTGLDMSGLWIAAVGCEVENLVIPDGITVVDNSATYMCTCLKSVHIPSSVKYVGVDNFQGNSLEYISGPYASADNRCYISFGRLQVFAGAGIRSYTTPSSVTSIGGSVFRKNSTIEELVINDEVTFIGQYAFAECPNLKSITLPASLVELSYDPFYKSTGIETVYLRSIVPPVLSSEIYTTVFPNLKIYVPDECLSLYENSDAWQVYRKYIEPKHYDNLIDPEFYISSDFSQDGTVRQFQTATRGAGINLIVMGDAFSDRQIADGTYESWMNKAMESFFSVEPYKSFRDMFNVYMVRVVSNTEGFEQGTGALGTVFGQGTYVMGNIETAKKYAFKAVDASKADDLTVIVIPNKDAYAGTCHMIKPASEGGYAQGMSIGWVPAQSNYESFSMTVNHEIGGHGFAKLQDEYFYSGSTSTAYDEAGYSSDREKYGWYVNMDFTSSPSDVCWSKFLNDQRYAGQGLGVYEGALFEYGAYRPSETSIMRDNVGGYNAPSREIIYKRIMSLAYGSSWTYDFEDFVSYDRINWNTSSRSAMRGVPMNFIPLAHPTVSE